MRDQQWVHEADHRGSDATGGLSRLHRPELAPGYTVGHDPAQHEVEALDMGDDRVPALLHCRADHLLHSGMSGEAGGVEPIGCGKDVAQPLGGGTILGGDAGDRLFLLALVALQHGFVDRLLGVEEAVDIRGAHP